MFKLKQSLVLLSGVIAFLVLSAPAYAQGPPANVPPPQNVKVVNTESEPVPVTGTVSVSNLGGTPLPVRDVDNPARQPFQASIIEPPLGTPNPVFFTVPAGKRLVIEYVSAEALALDPDCVTPPRFALTTTAGGTPLAHFFYPENSGTISFSGNTAKVYGLSRQTRIYADPLTQVKLNVRTDALPLCSYNSAGRDLHISGYLVNVP
jgi:hypothetical protein